MNCLNVFLKDITKNDNFDEKLYLDTLLDLKTKASKLQVQKMKEIHKILDKKQKEKFADYIKEWEIE